MDFQVDEKRRPTSINGQKRCVYRSRWNGRNCFIVDDIPLSHAELQSHRLKFIISIAATASSSLSSWSAAEAFALTSLVFQLKILRSVRSTLEIFSIITRVFFGCSLAHTHPYPPVSSLLFQTFLIPNFFPYILLNALCCRHESHGWSICFIPIVHLNATDTIEWK